MSILKLPLLFAGISGEKQLYTLFDSGANLSCINAEFAEVFGGVITMLRPTRLVTASADHYLEVREHVMLEFYIEGIRLSDEFLVVPGLSEEAILGATTLQKWRIKLDFAHDQVHVDPKVEKMQIGILKPLE